MDKYSATKTFSEQPPHVYAIGRYSFLTFVMQPYFISFLFSKWTQFLANEALNNLRMNKKSQSILITGVSGSGKTENGKHIMEILCQTSVCSQNVFKSVPILEAFGNARTRANSNSSRFCKHVEVKKFNEFWETIWY